MKVLVVDDSSPVRVRLVSMLRDALGVAVVLEAGDGVEALQKIEEFEPDVILLDLHMPRLGGLDVLRIVKTRRPCPAVIILTLHPTQTHREVCSRLGAEAFCDKSSCVEDLVEAVRPYVAPMRA